MVSVMLYLCMFCVALSMDLCVECLTVFVNCLVKQFANMFGCVCYFVVECDGVVICGWRCSIAVVPNLFVAADR